MRFKTALMFPPYITLWTTAETEKIAETNFIQRIKSDLGVTLPYGMLHIEAQINYDAIDNSITTEYDEILEKYGKFWASKYADKDDPRVVRVKGEHYFIGEEEDKPGFRGFSGKRFNIHFTDGRKYSSSFIVSTNLWYNGKLPDGLEKYLPDNAEFVD